MEPPASVEWLYAEPSTALPLRWLDRFVTEANRLDPDTAAELQSLPLLNETEIAAEVKRLSEEHDCTIEFIVDKESLAVEEEKLKHLREELDKANRDADALAKYAAKGLEIDLQAARELEFYKTLKKEREAQLLALTKEYEELTESLHDEKSKLLQTCNEQANLFLSSGEKTENQINKINFANYFSSSEYLKSLLGSKLSSYEKKIETEKHPSDKSESNNCKVNKLIHIHKKIEDGIGDYISTKATLIQEKESLKFLLSYSEYHPRNILCNEASANELIMKNTDNLNPIKSFVNNITAFLVFGELKTKMTEIENIYGEVEIVSNLLSSFHCCSEKILLSLKFREELIEDILVGFFSIVKLFITDIEHLDARNSALDQCSYLVNNDLSQYSKDIILMKDTIYNIFQINNDVHIDDAIKSIEAQLQQINEMKRSISKGSDDFILECIDNKRKIANIIDFIWDGAANQPNIFNKHLECDLYNFKKEIQSYTEKLKNISCKYKHLMDVHKCDLTLKQE